MSESTQSNSGAYASRYEHWEREYKRSVAQAHSLYSSGKTIPGDRALDYAATARRIAISERQSWVRAIVREAQMALKECGDRDASNAGKAQGTIGALLEMCQYLDTVFDSLKTPPE